MTVTTADAITVIRLDAPARCNPIERIISTVGRVDLALADALHDGDDIRPYAVARVPGGLEAHVCNDAIAAALLRGDPSARLGRRVRSDDLRGDGGETIALEFVAPAHFRVSGLEYMLPDPRMVFGGLYERWRALGWGELPLDGAGRVGCVPERMSFGRMDIGHTAQRGFLGLVRYDLRGLMRRESDAATREALWTLARFAEHRGVGKHTTYGMGRVRVVG